MTKSEQSSQKAERTTSLRGIPVPQLQNGPDDCRRNIAPDQPARRQLATPHFLRREPARKARPAHPYTRRRTTTFASPDRPTTPRATCRRPASRPAPHALYLTPLRARPVPAAFAPGPLYMLAPTAQQHSNTTKPQKPNSEEDRNRSSAD
jgi:hypothetical protein